MESTATGGFVLTAKAHPKLFAVLEDVAAALGTTMPTRVEAVAGTDVGVRTEQHWVDDDDHVLVLGLSAMATIDVAALCCVLAHELGHLKTGNVPTMEVVTAARDVLEDVRSGAAGGFLKRILGGAAARWLEKGAAYNRSQESEADAAAVAVYGGDAVERAQIQMALVQRREATFFATEVAPALEKTALAPRTLAGGFTAFMAHHAASDAALIALLLDDPATEENARYPTLRARIEAVRQAPTPEHPRAMVANGAADAITLFSDSDQLDSATSAAFIRALLGEDRDAVSWAELLSARLASEAEGAVQIEAQARDHLQVDADSPVSAVTDAILKAVADTDAFTVLRGIFAFEADAVEAVQARAGVDLEAEARVTLRDLLVLILVREALEAGAEPIRDFGGVRVGGQSMQAVAGAALTSLDPWTPLNVFRHTLRKKD